MKKLCAIVLIVLQIFAIYVYADEIKLTDTQKEDLYNLGIMVGDENGNLRLDDNITRAEVAKMICVAGNIRLQSDENEISFKDVSLEHWAYKYIYTIKEFGIADGDDNGNFNPESDITNEEIVKMIVCLLGYRQMAELQSGFPAGYTAIATQIGITKNLKLKTKTPAKRNDVAVMISNALDAPIMVQGEESDGATEYIVLDGKKGIPFASIRGTRGRTYDTSLKNIDRLAQAFASQYPYKEGDTEKSFELYPDIIYSSGMEKTADGTKYECPAIYDDNHAYDLVNQIRVVPVEFAVNDLSYEIPCATFNSELLVPYDVFKLMGCEVFFDKDTYVTTISKKDTVLEIIPNLIGMRKNKSEGYWVPLKVCARFIDDMLYMPLDAVANEFGYNAVVGKDTDSIILA